MGWESTAKVDLIHSDGTVGMTLNQTGWPDNFVEGGTPPFWQNNSAYGELTPGYPQATYFALDSEAPLSTTFHWLDYCNYSWPINSYNHQQYVFGFKIKKHHPEDPQYYMGVCRWAPYGSTLCWKWAIFDENFDFVYAPGNNYGPTAYNGTNAILGLATLGIYFLGDEIRTTCYTSVTDIVNAVTITQCANYGIHIPTFLAHCRQMVLGSDWIDSLDEVEDYSSPEYGDASTPEGYEGGTFDDSSDTISIPTAPSIGVSSAGFVNLYNPSAATLTDFGKDLFPDLNFTPVSNLPTPTDVMEAVENACTVLATIGNQIPNIVSMYINAQLINYVLDCHILPVAPTSSGSHAIQVGFKTFNQHAPKVDSDYVDFDCGTLNIGEYYANYIDYAPFTKCKLFLPFVGYVELLPEYWQSGSINVTYRFNVIDGSFMAFVKSTSSKSKLSDSVIGQYGGNCCVHIPITGANYSNMVTGLIQGAAAVATSGAGAVGKATKAIESAVDVCNMRPNVQSSNGYNSTSAFLGCRTPYLVIERTVASFSMSYPEECGLPSNVTETLSNVSGYTEASAIKVDIPGATEAECNEIAALLAGGVFL